MHKTILTSVLLATLVACAAPPADEGEAVDTVAAATDHDAMEQAEAATMDHEAMGHAVVAADESGEHDHEADAEAEFDSAAERFAEDVFGANTGDYGIAFVPDGDTVFFTRAIPGARTEAIFFTSRRDDGWSEPQIASFSGEFPDQEPFVSPDGRRLYFASKRPVAGGAERSDADIWYVERSGDTWGEPAHVAAAGSEFDDSYPTVAADGTLVFARGDAAGNVDLWIASASRGGIGAPAKIGKPVNTAFAEADPWIAPDGSYIIFSSPQANENAQGQGDLYVVYRDGDGWTAPSSLGLHVNNIGHDYGPMMSPDGEMFYFSRGFGGHVWMVPTSLLDGLR